MIGTEQDPDLAPPPYTLCGPEMLQGSLMGPPLVEFMHADTFSDRYPAWPSETQVVVCHNRSKPLHIGA